MGERTYTGKLVGDRDGFEATASDTFHMVHLDIGNRGDSYIIDMGEAESFARWILKISPYGNKRIGQ